MPEEIIIVGAGASGLMIARNLLKAGKKVLVIEARAEAGGRINTIASGEFSMHLEAGAEFVHGQLPHTINLLKEAGLTYHAIEGELWNARIGGHHKQAEFIQDHQLLLKKLKELQHDMSVAEFLDLHFKDERYHGIRASITGFVQGYDLADVEKASAFSLREEWLSGNEEEQFRVDKGYGALIAFLKSDCERKGCSFQFHTTIKKVEWKKNEVNLISADGRQYRAEKVVITVPLGILQSNSSFKGHIEFAPRLSSMIEAAKAMGYGEVIKFILEFNEPFWENKNVVGKKFVKNLGFLFSDAAIPTWWSQEPRKFPILTGWLGGPRVREMRSMNDDTLMQLALDSLSLIFSIDHAVLNEKLVVWRVFNWAGDDFSLGGYAYNSLNRKKHLSVLKTPVASTIFFSGEALAEGPTLGTVEAALASGLHTAKQILESPSQNT
jgi:monoamine oxidase